MCRNLFCSYTHNCQREEFVTQTAPRGRLRFRSAALPPWLSERSLWSAGALVLSHIISEKTEKIDALKLTDKADRCDPILFFFQKLCVSVRLTVVLLSPFITVVFRKQILWYLFFSIAGLECIPNNYWFAVFYVFQRAAGCSEFVTGRKRIQKLFLFLSTRTIRWHQPRRSNSTFATLVAVNPQWKQCISCWFSAVELI